MNSNNLELVEQCRSEASFDYCPIFVSGGMNPERIPLAIEAGGVLTLLDALPNVDCVFVAHAGLETFAKISSLLDGAVVGSSVRVKLWRVQGSDIPKREDERLRWLYAQWTKVDLFVKNSASLGG